MELKLSTVKKVTQILVSVGDCIESVDHANILSIRIRGIQPGSNVTLYIPEIKEIERYRGKNPEVQLDVWLAGMGVLYCFQDLSHPESHLMKLSQPTILGSKLGKIVIVDEMYSIEYLI